MLVDVETVQLRENDQNRFYLILRKVLKILKKKRQAPPCLAKPQSCYFAIKTVQVPNGPWKSSAPGQASSIGSGWLAVIRLPKTAAHGELADLCYPLGEERSSQYGGGHQEGSLEEVAEFLEVGKIESRGKGGPTEGSM